MIGLGGDGSLVVVKMSVEEAESILFSRSCCFRFIGKLPFA